MKGMTVTLVSPRVHAIQAILKTRRDAFVHACLHELVYTHDRNTFCEEEFKNKNEIKRLWHHHTLKLVELFDQLDRDVDDLKTVLPHILMHYVAPGSTFGALLQHPDEHMDEAIQHLMTYQHQSIQESGHLEHDASVRQKQREREFLRAIMTMINTPSPSTHET